MTTIRVFPRRTKATPSDELTVVNRPPGFFDEADAVHISVTFSWDIPRAEQLAAEWDRVAPVTIGGPAMGEAGGDFEPGRYLRPGYVITSRGCPNQCWFCDVWRREGPVRELPVRDGWIVQDNNLLACSDRHIRDVFTMLRRVRRHDRRVQFTGGLEAARLKTWHVEELLTVKPKQMFFAYDTPDDFPALHQAGVMLQEAGWTPQSKSLRAYVLCGFRADTLTSAEERMRDTLTAGFTPMAMLYRAKNGSTPGDDWRRFQRRWARPAMINA